MSKFIFKKGNLNGICGFLLDCNFDFCYNSTNINIIWLELKQIIIMHLQILFVNGEIVLIKLLSDFIPMCIITLIAFIPGEGCIKEIRILENSKLLLQSVMFSAKSTIQENLINDCAYSNSNKLFDYIHGLSGSDFTLPSPCDLPVSNSSLFNITILDSEVTVQASLLASHSQYCRLNY